MSKEKIEWFESWFNTKYYHILYKNRDFKEAEHFIDNLCSYLQLATGSRVLDLACGKGRHSIYLSQKNFIVDGVDLSPVNISWARKFEVDNLKFYVHDMREVFKSNTYDCIFNLFTSFGYFDDLAQDRKVLQGAKAGLLPQGRFIFDYLNPSYSTKKFRPFEVLVKEGVKFEISRSFDQKKITKHIKVIDEDLIYKFKEEVSNFNSATLQALLQQEGFVIEEIFGNYNLDNFNEETSERQIYICRNINH